MGSKGDRNEPKMDRIWVSRRGKERRGQDRREKESRREDRREEEQKEEERRHAKTSKEEAQLALRRAMAGSDVSAIEQALREARVCGVSESVLLDGVRELSRRPQPVASASNSTVPMGSAVTDAIPTQPVPDGVPVPPAPPPPPWQSRSFTHAELLSATNQFSERLGSGGFGTVYGGCLSSGTPIAVKVLTQDPALGAAAGLPSDEQLMTEVRVLSEVSHPNVVPLLGSSLDGPQKCLVYAHMDGGALDERLARIGGQHAISAL